MTDLRDYARKVGELYASQGDAINPMSLLAEHGEENTFSPLPESEECGQAKNCYGNAASRVLLGPEGLTYYEGLCYGDIFPFEHAWAQDADGRVYELTLRHNDDECAFCFGNGSLSPYDHWDYYGDGDDIEDEADIDCEICKGTGKAPHGPVDRSGTKYLGIPIPAEAVHEIIHETGTYGCLFSRPQRIAEMLGVG